MARVLPPFNEHLLPSNSTALERVFAAAVNSRTAAIPIPLRLLNDPYQCQAVFLDHLAFEVGVDIWSEDWDELKKRSVIATTIRTKEILGTVAGIEAYVCIENADVVDVVVPPQTPFVSKALSDDQYAAWLGQLPQLRIYFGNDQSIAATGQSFIGKTFIGTAITMSDQGRDLLGRRAFYYDHATDTETRITLADLGATPALRAVAEQVFVPGRSSPLEAYPNRFIGNCYLSLPLSEPRTVSYFLQDDGSNSLNAGALALSLGPSFDPVNTRFDRVPVFGKRTAEESFVGVSFIGFGFVSTSTAAINFYDRLYLADPTVHAPVTAGTTYVGHSRLQMEPFRAEVLIDAHETISPAIAVESRFVGNCFAIAQDDTKRNRILQAIELSKSGRDRVFVDFQVTKVLTFGDTPVMDGSFTLGQRLPRNRL